MEPGQVNDGGVAGAHGTNPRVSVVIPTFNRADDLSQALNAIVSQSIVPFEVIVVDDSLDDKTKKLLEAMSGAFSDRGSTLRYVKNPRERGVGISRNVGIETAQGDIVQFTDDDVILQPGFFETVLKVYRNHPDAVGVQGHLIIDPEAYNPDSMYNTLRKMFCLSYTTHRGCRVLRSFKTTYPVKGKGADPCEWMSGCSQSFRREALGDIRNDERMKRYSAGDDLDISYNVWRHSGGRLYLSFDARVLHKEAQIARSSSNRMLYIDSIYSYYLFRKNVPRSVLSSAAYYWSRLGQLMLNLFEQVRGPSGPGRAVGRLQLKHLFRAQILWLSKRKEIAAGELSFFDEYLDM